MAVDEHVTVATNHWGRHLWTNHFRTKATQTEACDEIDGDICVIILLVRTNKEVGKL